MLENTLQRWPAASLTVTEVGFGARLDEQTSLLIASNGPLTDGDMRDLLALFAVWLVADPAMLREGGIRRAGRSVEESVPLQRLSGQRICEHRRPRGAVLSDGKVQL
jgi:hypothetical protein